MSGETARLATATPILRVNELAASVAYYTKILGFKVDWESGGAFCSLSRDRCNLFLCEGCQGHGGTWVWTGTNDADRLYAEWVASGAKILTKPTNYPWGSREVHVMDLDGHVLRFASDATGEDYGEFPADRTES
jgi:catechol 2,3-dioxygenase-like lactoylglutathione lyase family enzyme